MSELIVNNFVPLTQANAQTITADTALTTIDLTQCVGGVAWLLHLTAIGAGDASNYMTATIEESSDGTNWTAIPTATESERYLTPFNRTAFNPQPVTPAPAGTDMYGSGPLVINSTAMTGVYLLGMAPGVKRYVRLKFIETGTASITVTCYALKKPRTMPYPATI